MKKITFFIAILALPFLLFSQTENITVANGNSGFEEGFDGWSRIPKWDEGSMLEITTTNPNTGAKALYYPGSDEKQILTTTIINLDVGETYALTFWSAGTEADVYVVRNKNEDSTHYAINNNNSGEAYNFHTMIFTALNASGKMALKFHFKATDGGDPFTIYLDDVNVLPLVAGGNIGFEDDFTNWTRWKDWWPAGSDIVISTDNPYLGNKSAYYPGGDNVFQQLFSNISGLQIGKTYTFIFQASGKSSDFYIGPVGDVYSGTYHFVNANSADYVEQSMVFTATATTMKLQFDFYPDEEDGNVIDMHVDDFHILQRIVSGKLLINEVNTNPAAGASYVEFYNSTGINLLLLGLQLEVYRDNSETPSAILVLPDDLLESKAYLTITKDNTAFYNLHGFYADLEFPDLDLNAIDGLILKRDVTTDIDHFNHVPIPDSPPNNHHLYLRKGTLLENGGSNLTEHWCDVGANRIGTPGAANLTNWNTGSDGAWETGSSWSSGYEPCACEDVIIPTTGNPTITISTMDGAARSVLIETGAHLMIVGKLHIGENE